MRKSIVLSAAVAVVLTIAVVAGALFLLRGGAEDATPTRESAEATGAGGADSSPDSDNETETNTAPRPECPAGPVAGVDLPCLGADDTDDHAADKGITVVNVWAWWCVPCRTELPAMQEVADTHPDWTVVGVHADQNAAAGADLLNDLGVDLPSYQDDSNAFASALELPRVVPITVVLVDGEVKETIAKPFAKATDITDAVEGAIAS